MSFFKNLSEFFQSIFMPSSPESKRKRALKKIESDLRNVSPVIFKNDQIAENFAEALRLMLVNTKPIFDVLVETVCSDDLERNHLYSEQLLLTGFPSEIQEVLENLEFERRKQNAREADSLIRFMENEHRQLERIVKYLNTPEFVRIDSVLDSIKQISEVCTFSYVSALRVFDINFSSAQGYNPQFQATPPELLEGSLTDFYFVVHGLDINNSTCNAIIALADLRAGGKLSDDKKAALRSNLKKIHSLVRRVFTEDNLVNLIRLAKKDPEYVPKKAVYQENSRKKYADYLEKHFLVDSERLKSELQDETITHELSQIFGTSPRLLTLVGYNAEVNKQLMQSTPESFTFIMPMQILRSFLTMYYEDHIKPLMNDIVIEGYFNNAAYKSEVSSSVYALGDSLERISHFENKFSRGGKYDEVVLTSLIRESHKDTTFGNKLKDMVDTINREAKDVIQTEVNHVFQMYKIMGEILIETKKAHSDIITNLKVLTLSSRNRDNYELLEKQYNLWTMFLEIMKNYVIISNTEKK